MSLPLATVILAAGLGTRMKSNRAKVLHKVAGRPMIEYPVELARALGSGRVVTVLGHQADVVRATLEQRFGAGAVEVAIQAEQKGTGHAVQQAAPLLQEGFEHLLLILYGDVPLLTRATVDRLVAAANERTLALVTFEPADPGGYGRVVRLGGHVSKIVEHKDCTDEQRKIRECNAGIYCGPASFILRALDKLQPNNAQGELYLTDVVERAARELSVEAVVASVEEVMGVNDRIDLASADRVMRRRLAEILMREGVTVRDPERLYVEPGVQVGRDVELGPGVELRGRTVIGDGCRIDQGAIITDSTLGQNVHVKPYVVISESTVADQVDIGPWAHLRPGSEISTQAHIGNFVEIKKTKMGPGAKAGHLTYLGDAVVGARVNVGCGTITCNYDGYRKSTTIIEDDAFIGSDTALVAPVRVGAGAVVGAGSTITEDVPAGALALTRAKQVHVAGYTEKKRQKMMSANGAPSKPASKPAAKKKPSAPVKGAKSSRRRA